MISPIWVDLQVKKKHTKKKSRKFEKSHKNKHYCWQQSQQNLTELENVYKKHRVGYKIEKKN